MAPPCSRPKDCRLPSIGMVATTLVADCSRTFTPIFSSSSPHTIVHGSNFFILLLSSLFRYCSRKATMTTSLIDTIVPSFLSGQWLTPDNPSRITEVADPSTGEIVARVSAEGLDIAAAVDYARDVGRKNLQELTIHERSLKIKELAIFLQNHRDELNALAHKTGANKRDNFVDVDGGISTMFTISSKGRREMPNSHVVTDGEPEVFSKDGSFIGRHVYTTIPGIAVQINAFNFPV